MNNTSEKPQQLVPVRRDQVCHVKDNSDDQITPVKYMT